MPLPVGDQLPRGVPVMNLSWSRLVARRAAGLATTSIIALLSSGVFPKDATPVPTSEATPTPEEILRGNIKAGDTANVSAELPGVVAVCVRDVVLELIGVAYLVLRQVHTEADRGPGWTSIEPTQPEFDNLDGGDQLRTGIERDGC